MSAWSDTVTETLARALHAEDLVTGLATVPWEHLTDEERQFRYGHARHLVEVLDADLGITTEGDPMLVSLKLGLGDRLRFVSAWQPVERES